jgi:hypothetical protein
MLLMLIREYRICCCFCDGSRGCRFSCKGVEIAAVVVKSGEYTSAVEKSAEHAVAGPMSVLNILLFLGAEMLLQLRRV